MENDSDGDGDTVEVSMSISGPYDDVLPKLQSGAPRRDAIKPIIDDLEILLETIDRMNGGTRSAIAQQLPSKMTGTFDAEAVVETLQVLERYELVALDGNTWKPGPKLQE